MIYESFSDPLVLIRIVCMDKHASILLQIISHSFLFSYFLMIKWISFGWGWEYPIVTYQGVHVICVMLISVTWLRQGSPGSCTDRSQPSFIVFSSESHPWRCNVCGHVVLSPTPWKRNTTYINCLWYSSMSVCLFSPICVFDHWFILCAALVWRLLEIPQHYVTCYLVHSIFGIWELFHFRWDSF